MKNTTYTHILLTGFFILSIIACSPTSELNNSTTQSWVQKVKKHFESQPGGSLLLEAMEAHGGLENWHQKKSISFRWIYHMTDRTPAKSIDTFQTIDISTLFAKHTTPDSDVIFGRDKDGYWLFPEQGKTTGNARFWTLTPYYFFAIPFCFSDLNITTEKLADCEFEGKSYSQIKITFSADSGDSPEDYYTLLIDPQSKRIRGTKYIVTSPIVNKNPNKPRSETFITLDDLTEISGILLPNKHRSFNVSDGEITTQKRHSEVKDISFSKQAIEFYSAPQGAQRL